MQHETGTGKYEQLLTRCKTLSPIPAAVAHPCDTSSLVGAVEAASHGLIEPLLVGPRAKIAEAALDPQDRMYSYDALSLSRASQSPGVPQLGQRTMFVKFEEYVRVNIDRPPSRPDGGTLDIKKGEQSPHLEGSRASYKYLWSVGHTLATIGAFLERTTGDQDETGTNYVKEGH